MNVTPLFDGNQARYSAVLPQGGRAGAAAGQEKVEVMQRSVLKSRFSLGTSAWAAAVAMAAFVSLPATEASAQDTGKKSVAARVRDMGAAERLVLAAGIRSDGQTIAASLCFAQAGINADDNKKQASEAMAEISATLDALANGNEALGVPSAEANAPVKSSFNGVQAQWTPFSAAAQKLIDGTDTEVAFDYLTRQNQNMSFSSRRVLQRIMQFYVEPPELLQSYAFTLEIAARQSALTQHLAKELCGLATSNNTMGNVARLQNSVRLFDLSLGALREGFDAAGVITPPTPEIAAALEAVKADWESVKPEVLNVKSLGGIDVVGAAQLATRLDEISAKMAEITTAYVQASKFKG